MSELGALADGLGDPCSARSSLRSSHGSHTSRSGGGVGSGSLGGGGANSHSGGGSRFAFPPSATRSTRGSSLGADTGNNSSSGQGLSSSLEHGIAGSGPSPEYQQPRSFEQMIRSGGSKDKTNAK